MMDAMNDQLAAVHIRIALEHTKAAKRRKYKEIIELQLIENKLQSMLKVSEEVITNVPRADSNRNK